MGCDDQSREDYVRLAVPFSPVVQAAAVAAARVCQHGRQRAICGECFPSQALTEATGGHPGCDGLSGLDAFAETTKRPHRCGVCRLPADLLEIVRANKRRTTPHPYTTVSQFLESKGHRVTPNMLRDHFLLRHEETR